MKKLLALCLLLLCSGSVMAEKEEVIYLCIDEIATGIEFVKDSNSWKSEELKDVDGKLIIKVNDKKHPKYIATATIFGQKEPEYNCPQIGKGKQVHCVSDKGDLIFNRKALRFFMTIYGGSDDESLEYSLMIGGSCTPL